MTQEALAGRSGVSVDTIRRLEGDAFSPGISTLLKLCTGLDLLLSTFFAALELCENDITREVLDLLTIRSSSDQILALNLLRLVFANMDGQHDAQRIAAGLSAASGEDS